ncbi:MAG: alpha/beta fold hydrolase [Cryobacterium sp.]|nr:alpha/beta fold hydrolase [Cryobacterium sp.]
MGVEVRHAATAGSRSLLALGIAAGVGFGTAVATFATASKIAHMVLVPPKSREQDVEIFSADLSSGRIVLGRSPATALEGRYGLWFEEDSGHAAIGEVISQTSDTITRELLWVDLGELRSPARGRLSGWLQLDPNRLDLPFEEVEIAAELGGMPAWLFPAEGSSASTGTGTDWVIQIHGRAATRAEGFRAVPVFRDAGLSSLLISYRNDSGAPESPDFRYALGDREWRDAEAAIEFALSRGARLIVLMGWSMGGAIALQTLFRSRYRDRIAGLVLDSPVVDWYTTLDHQGKEMGFRGPLRKLTYLMISRPWGKFFTGMDSPIDLDRLNVPEHPERLKVPTLILHSRADDYVPSSGSELLAESRPDLVTLELFEQADHTRLWNLDPDRWDTVISNWLNAQGLSSQRP